MIGRFKTRPTPQPAEDAARWLLRLESGKLSSGQQADFEAWVEAHPTHREALERAAGALDLASRHAAAPDLMQMREAALRAHGKPRASPWLLAASVAGASVLVVAIWATGRHAQPISSPTLAATRIQSAPATHYATEVGERATVSLPDGSIATLDTQSAFDVTYTSTERGVRLLHGQALFEVAKDKAMPFQVYAGGRRITAVGTTFNVRVDGQRLRVALLEGRIRVALQPSNETTNIPVAPVTLNPGEILDTAQAPLSVKVADVTRTATWREGVSAFVDVPLSDVVAEMNRYLNTPILIEEPATGALRISGVFKTGDPERFAESVAKVFPITIDHSAAGSVVLRAQPMQK